MILTLLLPGCWCSAMLLVALCGLCCFGWRPMLCASPFSLLLLYRLFKYVYLYTVITYIPKPIVSAVKVWFSGAGASAAHLNRGVASGRESPPWSSPRYRPRLNRIQTMLRKIRGSSSSSASSRLHIMPELARSKTARMLRVGMFCFTWEAAPPCVLSTGSLQPLPNDTAVPY